MSCVQRASSPLRSTSAAGPTASYRFKQQGKRKGFSSPQCHFYCFIFPWKYYFSKVSSKHGSGHRVCVHIQVWMSDLYFDRAHSVTKVSSKRNLSSLIWLYIFWSRTRFGLQSLLRRACVLGCFWFVREYDPSHVCLGELRPCSHLHLKVTPHLSISPVNMTQQDDGGCQPCFILLQTYSNQY